MGVLSSERELTGAEALRHRMVREQLVGRGISDARVLAAMARVPRERFVPTGIALRAYEDNPLPIGDGQTISQPYIVAFMTEALELGPTDRVLEVGTGSGYGAAVLGCVAGEVFTVECFASLAEEAERRLTAFGPGNVQVRRGDGALGWPDAAPFDGISVTAAALEIPPALLAQLAVGGRLVLPLGPEGEQVLYRVRRIDDTTMRSEPLLDVRFVPLLGPGAQGGGR